MACHFAVLLVCDTLLIKTRPYQKEPERGMMERDREKNKRESREKRQKRQKREKRENREKRERERLHGPNGVRNPNMICVWE